MDNYSIILPNEKSKAYKWVSFIVAFMCMAFFGLIRTKSEVEAVRFFSGFGFIWLLISIPGYWFYKTKRKVFVILIPIFVSSLICLSMGFYLFGFGLFVFSFFGYFANRKLAVGVNEIGVIYPSFPSKLFEWRDIEQVLIKDNVLTIDLKNNKLIQISISEEENEKLEHQAFNAFCNALIHQSK